ncbi:DUF6114 domain-containing protein [Nocardiopsis sp. LOL_012]|uniref:DUF6114 domain-containing protein n=1 Tax=Nocardiopsis sp. LOL_012 TaxID=3345409 RepID=UPI003A84C07B
MAHALDLLRAGWGRFRSWRRTRPFWGGLLLVAAGVEILIAPAAQSLIIPIDLIIYAGIAGVSGTLIGALLTAVGVLSWLQTAQHTFFGIVGLMLALVSFVTSNFGGFVIGMLLGIIGGALVFAWAPDVRRRPRGRRRTRSRADAGEGYGGGEPAGEGSGTDGGGGVRPPAGHRPLAAVALPGALALLLASGPAPASDFWDWLFPDREDPEEAVDPSADPSDGPTAPPSAAPSGEPSADVPPSAEPTGPAGDEDTEEDADAPAEEEAGGAAEDCPIQQDGALTPVETEEELAEAVTACQAAEAAGELPEVQAEVRYDCFTGSTRTSGLTSDVLLMHSASYGGVVECPTADGVRRYIRLDMSRADFTGAELWFQDAGTRMSLGLPQMTMDGDVHMHITRMQVTVLGLVPLDLTPDDPLLPLLELLPLLSALGVPVTDVDVAQPMAATDHMSIPGLNSQHTGS